MGQNSIDEQARVDQQDFDDPFWLAWAKKKADPDGNPVYHSVRNHCLDVAAVADCLWRLALNDSDRHRMAEGLGLPVYEAGNLLTFLAGSHDVGKLTPAFQSKDVERFASLPAEWLLDTKQAVRYKTPHGTQTATILKRFVEGEGLDPEFALAVASAIGGHHGSPIRQDQITEVVLIELGQAPWVKAQNRLLAHLREAAGLNRFPTSSTVVASTMVVLAGLTSVADWIASDEDLFPYDGSREGPLEYFAKRRSLAEKNLTLLGWTPSPAMPEFGGFRELFGITQPSGLQRAMLEAAQCEPGPALLIAEAPMGDGKTEAAFAAAAVMRRQFGMRGLYCALPTQATSDQMFTRLIAMLERYGAKDAHVIGLLHCQAWLSDEFAELRRQGREYLNPTGIAVESGNTVLASDWFSQAKRGLLTPFGVGTIDQCLMAVLKRRHFFVRVFGLWGKVLIIDEVHAFDTFMTRTLQRLLEWAARIGTPVILLSATLPKRRREQLCLAYARGLEIQRKPAEVSRYPRITVLGRKGERCIPVEARSRPKSVGLRPVRRDALAGLLGNILADGGNIAVICNTVASARKVYCGLKAAFPSEVDLLHSRFLVGERRRRVDRVLARVSKGAARPARSILVSTQIIEQSLDIDFDLLVTELCPVDLLLQRMGRLQRHDRPVPKAFTEPQVWVIEPELHEGAPDFGASAWVYDEHILLRTWLLLRDLERVELPKEIESLIEAVYGDGDQLREGAARRGLQEQWSKTSEAMVEQIAVEEDAASNGYIKPPAADFLSFAIDDRGGPQPLTRLFRPSVSLIAVYRQRDGFSCDAEGADTIRTDHPPDYEQLKRMVENSGQYPLQKKHILPEVSELPEAWQQRAALRGFHLLTLDENHAGAVGNLELRLDPELGICGASP